MVATYPHPWFHSLKHRRFVLVGLSPAAQQALKGFQAPLFCCMMCVFLVSWLVGWLVGWLLFSMFFFNEVLHLFDLLINHQPDEPQSYDSIYLSDSQNLQQTCKKYWKLRIAGSTFSQAKWWTHDGVGSRVTYVFSDNRKSSWDFWQVPLSFTWQKVLSFVSFFNFHGPFARIEQKTLWSHDSHEWIYWCTCCFILCI